MEELRMAVGQAGEEKACFLTYICWSTEGNTGIFFTWLHASWSVCHLPVMHGHAGWEDGAPRRAESFIPTPVILAGICHRHNRRGHQGLHRSPSVGEWGEGLESPKFSKHKEHMAVLSTAAPRWLFARLSQFLFFTAANEVPWPGPALAPPLHFAPSSLTHTVQVWWPAVYVSWMWPGFSFLRLGWGWVGPWNTFPECSQGWFLLVISALRPQFPCPPCHLSDVVLPPHPLSFLNCILLPALYYQDFLVYFRLLLLFWMKAWWKRGLDCSFHHCIWHTVGAQ